MSKHLVNLPTPRVCAHTELTHEGPFQGNLLSNSKVLVRSWNEPQLNEPSPCWMGFHPDLARQGLRAQILAAKRELEEKTAYTVQLDQELQQAPKKPARFGRAFPFLFFFLPGE